MIGKNTILSLLVACGLLLVGPAANADSLVGRCNSLIAVSMGSYNQIEQGINVVDNCNALAVDVANFTDAGCNVPFGNGELFVSDIFLNGKSCNVLSAICDGLDFCFGASGIPACDLVPACTIQ